MRKPHFLTWGKLDLIFSSQSPYLPSAAQKRLLSVSVQPRGEILLSNTGPLAHGPSRSDTLHMKYQAKVLNRCRTDFGNSDMLVLRFSSSR